MSQPRPHRHAHAERVARLFGAPPPPPAAPAPAPLTERDLLDAFLFAPSEVLADARRARSRGPDGTVSLEEHAGIEAEVEAAADWVARQLLDHATPLEEIAVLAPAADPLCGLVARRLSRLGLAVHVADGLPLTDTAGGARALAVIRALRRHLAADALAEVLPALRTAEDARGLSRGAALELAYSLGTVGGNAANPRGALEWTVRAERREAALAAAVAKAVDDDAEETKAAREGHAAQRLLEALRAVRPALDALVAVARRSVTAAPLGELWRALRGFLSDHVRLPADGAPAVALLDEALSGACADATCAALSGDEAWSAIEDALRRLRVPVGRFGEPRVYVGDVASAAGLSFEAVRVVGLSEGALPAAPRESPVLPDALRARFPEAALPTRAGRVLAQLHAVHRVVAGVRGRVAFSAARFDVDRSQREPSSLFLELAAALGRPTHPPRAVPDARALQRVAFRPAREDADAWRHAHPLSPAARLDRAARTGLVPARWLASPELNLARLRALQTAGDWTALDGLVGDALAIAPGLSAGAALSASRLRVFLECPHRFLLETVLRLREPASAPALRELDALSYGSLFHAVAEAFYEAHGDDFAARRSTLASWKARAAEIASAQFDDFLEQRPLIGAAVRRQQRQRLVDEFVALVEYDWPRGERRFVGVERGFGYDAPVPLAVGGRTLHVHGFIDRLDVEGDRTLIRDWKTGRAHPRERDEAGPVPTLDVQLAVYGLAVRHNAEAWGVPREVAAAYAYTDPRYERERSFREDFGALAARAAQWLSLAASMIGDGHFPRSPDPDDCRSCAFAPVCGPDTQAKSAALLARETGPLLDFHLLKTGEPA